MIYHFTKRILVFTGFISLIATVLFLFVIPKYYLPVFPYLIIFFTVLTIGIHTVLTKAGKKKFSRFSNFFMASITAKLFIYIIFMAIYIIVNRATAVPFLITFLILYILFTFFETYSLLNDLKKQTPSDI